MTDNVETEMTMDDVMELLMNNDFFFQVMESSGSDWVRRILMKVKNAEEKASYCEHPGESVLVLAAAYAELWKNTSTCRINDVYLGYDLLEEKLFKDTFSEQFASVPVDGEEVHRYFTLSKLGNEFLENPPYRLTVQMTGEKHTDWLSAQILRLIKDYREYSSKGYADILIKKIQDIVESREKPPQRW